MTFYMNFNQEVISITVDTGITIIMEKDNDNDGNVAKTE
jgi:hypothetical protein